MKETSVSQNNFRSDCIFHAFRTFVLILVYWGTLVASPPLYRVELS